MSASQRLASRRRVLRGMAGATAVTVGLPFLDCFLNTNGTALAATGANLPVCFGTWFWGCGLTPGQWEPKKTGKMDALGPELKALERFRGHINVFSGMKAFLDGNALVPHQSGQRAAILGDTSKQALHPSIDSIVADSIGKSTRFRSLEAAATGNAGDSVSRRSATVVNPSEVSPAKLYTRLFGPEFKDPNAAEFVPDVRVMVRQSMLSAIKEPRQSLARELGAADRARLDEYFTSLRELENQLDLQLQKPAPLPSCTPAAQDTEVAPGTEIETVIANHKLFARLMAHAIACDQTRVINMVFADGSSSLRKRGDSTNHHFITHEEPIDKALGYQPTVLWFEEQIMEGFATLLAAFDSIREGEGTVLDRILVMAASETGFAHYHTLDNIPMFTAGRAGGRVKAGLHIAAPGDPVTRVGLTVQQALGLPVSTWGTQSLATSKTVSEIIA